MIHGWLSRNDFSSCDDNNCGSTWENLSLKRGEDYSNGLDLISHQNRQIYHRTYTWEQTAKITVILFVIWMVDENVHAISMTLLSLLIVIIKVHEHKPLFLSLLHFSISFGNDDDDDGDDDDDIMDQYLLPNTSLRRIAFSLHLYTAV